MFTVGLSSDPPQKQAKYKIRNPLTTHTCNILAFVIITKPRPWEARSEGSSERAEGKGKDHKVERKCANLKISSPCVGMASKLQRAAKQPNMFPAKSPSLTRPTQQQRLWSTIINVLPKGRRHIYDCTFHIRFRIRLSTRPHKQTRTLREISCGFSMFS